MFPLNQKNKLNDCVHGLTNHQKPQKKGFDNVFSGTRAKKWLNAHIHLLYVCVCVSVSVYVYLYVCAMCEFFKLEIVWLKGLYILPKNSIVDINLKIGFFVVFSWSWFAVMCRL